MAQAGLAHCAHQGLRASDQAACGVSVPAEVFGHGVQHQVDAQLQRAHQARGAEGVVGHSDGAMRARHGGHLGQVVQAQRGVGEGFHPDHAGGRGQAGLQAARGGVHHRDAPALAQIAQQAFGAAIQRAQKHQFIPRAQKPQQHRRRCRRAAGKRHGGCGPFQVGHLGLQRGHGGVGEAAVAVAGGFARKDGGAPLQRAVAKGRGLADGRGNGAGGGVGVLASVDSAGAQVGHGAKGDGLRCPGAHGKHGTRSIIVLPSS